MFFPPLVIASLAWFVTPYATASVAAAHAHMTRSIVPQWDETKVISLAGMTSVCKQHLSCLGELPEFPLAWKLFLRYVEVCFGRHQSVAIFCLLLAAD